MCVPQRLFAGLQSRSGRDFRKQQSIRAGMGCRRHIGMTPIGIETIDPDDDFAFAKAAGLDRGTGHVARIGLGVGSHRIFQIQNDTVGIKRLGFF